MKRAYAAVAATAAKHKCSLRGGALRAGGGPRGRGDAGARHLLVG